MGTFAAGQVVVVPFPYSDLTGQKHRPVLLLTSAGHNDWVICQITSNPYSDPFAIELTQNSFALGGLQHNSYARPLKLFTANESLISAQAGTLKVNILQNVRQAVITLLQRP